MMTNNDPEGRIFLSYPKIRPKGHRLASRGLQSVENGDPEGLIFLSYPPTNSGYFFLLTRPTVFFYFKISFPEVPECNFT